MSTMNQALKQFTDFLKLKQLKVVTAESCTGGLLASLLTERAGSSNWFDRGFVTYSNAAKQTLLQVPALLIAQFGAVSIEVACSMAKGALLASDAHSALAITGIAGPSGGSVDKPVGTVCFAWMSRNQSVQSLRCELTEKTRSQVRKAACLIAIESWHHYLLTGENLR